MKIKKLLSYFLFFLASLWLLCVLPIIFLAVVLDLFYLLGLEEKEAAQFNFPCSEWIERKVEKIIDFLQYIQEKYLR